jgi:hypothetical protein
MPMLLEAIDMRMALARPMDCTCARSARISALSRASSSVSCGSCGAQQ